MLWGLNTATWTAIGTIALVAVTAVYAFLTWRLARHAKSSAEQAEAEVAAVRAQVEVANRQVEVANRQVEVSTEAMQAAIRPWLSFDPHHGEYSPVEFADEPGRYTLQLVLTNVGVGLGILDPQRCRLLFVHDEGSLGLAQGTPSHGVVPPDGRTRLHFVVQSDTRYGKLQVHATYSDAAGGQATTAEFLLEAVEQAGGGAIGDYKVVSIRYRSVSNDTLIGTVQIYY